MKVVFHDDFYQVYASDPAAEQGRMEAVIEVIGPHVPFLDVPLLKLPRSRPGPLRTPVTHRSDALGCRAESLSESCNGRAHKFEQKRRIAP